MKRKYYEFRAAFLASTIEEILVKYLKQKNTDMTEKDKVFGATLAHWLPFAAQSSSMNEVQVKQYARTAIYKLQQHIHYLACSFGLEDEFKSIDLQQSLSRLRLEGDNATHDALSDPVNMVESTTPNQISSQEYGEICPDALQVKTRLDFVTGADDDTVSDMFLH